MCTCFFLCLSAFYFLLIQCFVIKIKTIVYLPLCYSLVIDQLWVQCMCTTSSKLGEMHDTSPNFSQKNSMPCISHVDVLFIIVYLYINKPKLVCCNIVSNHSRYVQLIRLNKFLDGYPLDPDKQSLSTAFHPGCELGYPCTLRCD